MKRIAFVAVLCLIPLPISADAPAQPKAEAEVAQEFEAAAPALFADWLARRPEDLIAGSLGRLYDDEGWRWFNFTLCKDVVAPSTYQINVRKTDSLTTPFLGELIVPVKETCTNRVLHGGVTSMKAIDRLIPFCVDQPYDACLKAGGKAPSGFAKFNGMPPAVANNLTFPLEDETTVLYAWRGGKWEFDKEQRPEMPVAKRPVKS